MAAKSGTVKPTATARGDAFVADRLAHAQQRIRGIDLAVAGLVFVAGTCAYAAVMIAADSLLARAEVARELLFGGYLVGAVAYLAYFVVRPLTLRVNPYFAARAVERTLPGAKNSVVNWIDLHSRPLPAAVRNALGLRAAKDIARADLDSAVSGRQAGIAGGLAALAGVVLFVMLLWLGGGPFMDGLSRAFAPFRFSGPSRTRTQLTLVRPESGNVTVPVGRSLTVTVEVNGKIPDPQSPEAVRLLYRYGEGDPWLERPMTDEGKREFSATITATEVRSGFWYKVAGGDAETAEYRVGVRSTPQLTEFQATYHFPAYAAVPKETRPDRVLRAVRGSEVVLWALTNRTIHESHLTFEGKEGRKTFPGLRVSGDAQAFQVRMPLEESGRYRLGFTSVEGDTFTEPLQAVEVVSDKAPDVRLTKPGADASLPANGLLSLAGQADDDFGVRELTLRMTAGDRILKPRPYRSAEALRLTGGGYPRMVEYLDSVDLATLQADDAAPFRPQAGLEIEYWLEAADACAPTANVGSSRHFRVKLTEPQKDEAKRQKEREEAKKEQQKHDAKQDEQIKQEGESRKEQSKEADQKEKEHGKPQDKKDKGEAGKQPDKQDAQNPGQNGGAEKQKDPGDGKQPQENKGDGAGKSPEEQKKEQENQKNAENLKQVLENKNNDKQDPSEQKENSQAGKGQPDGNSGKGGDKADQKPSADKDKPPEKKPDQAGNDGQGGGDPKSGPAKPDAKAGGGENGNSKPMPGDNSGANGPKDGSKPDDKAAQPKDPGSGSTGGQPGADKKPGEPKPGDQQSGADSKPQGQDSEKKGSQEGQPKPDGAKEPQPGTKPEPKREGPNQPGANAKPQGEQNQKPSQEKPTPGNDPGTQKPTPEKKQSDSAKGQDGADSRKADAGSEGSSAKPGEKSNADGSGESPGKPAEKKDAGSTKGDGKAENKPGEAKGRTGNDAPAGGQEGAEKKPGENKPGDPQPQAGSKPQEKKDPQGGQPKPGDNRDSKPGEKPESKGDGQKGTNGQAQKETDSKPGQEKPGQEKGHGPGKQDPSKEDKKTEGKGAGPDPKETPADKSAGKDVKEAKPEDAQKAAKDLGNADPNKRAEAAKKLEDMSKNAKDAETREQARKALEQAKDPAKGGDPAGGKAEKPDGKQGAEPGQKADKPGGEKAEGGDPKGSAAKQEGTGGDRNGQRAAQKPGAHPAPGSGASQPGEKGNGSEEKSDHLGQDGKQGEVKPDLQNKDKNAKKAAADTPGEGGLESVRTPATKNDPTGPAPEADAKRRPNKRTELQLEDLDKVTKKDLEAAKLTEKDLAALRKWLQEQKNRRPKTDPKEAAVAPGRGEGSSFSNGRVQPGKEGKPNDLSGGNRAAPPPGYREANEEFKRRINKGESEAPQP
jgi:hypothetical protein